VKELLIKKIAHMQYTWQQVERLGT